MSTIDIIEHLARLASRHKLVPFLGAGCSFQHLRLDWDSICADMAAILGIENNDNKITAQEYVSRKGKVEFCDFLKSKLLISEFKDSLGECHLLIMSLHLGVIYTTNQDNVMEKCLEKHGRVFRKIVQLEDLGESTPGDTLYIKFHGDLDIPNSIVFTDDDFRARILDIDNFLNIRLRSDLLAKSLLFVGYSLRDPNMQNLLSELQTAFKGRLPPTYLIAFQSSPDLEARCVASGITVIVPRTIFPDASSDEEAFLHFLAELNKQVFHLKQQQEFESIFEPSVPPSRKVLTRHEVTMLKNMDALSLKEKLARFRALVDAAYIPEEYEQDITDIFLEFAKQCNGREDFLQMKGALHNLYLSKPLCKLTCISAAMAIVNSIDTDSQGRMFMSMYNVHMHDVDEGLNIVAVAVAIELLIEWGREISETMKSYTSHCFDFGADFQSLPTTTQDYVSRFIDIAWSKYTTLEHPIERQIRLKESPLKRLIPLQSRSDIERTFLDSFPRSIRKPYED